MRWVISVYRKEGNLFPLPISVKPCVMLVIILDLVTHFSPNWLTAAGLWQYYRGVRISSHIVYRFFDELWCNSLQLNAHYNFMKVVWNVNVNPRYVDIGGRECSSFLCRLGQGFFVKNCYGTCPGDLMAWLTIRLVLYGNSYVKSACIIFSITVKQKGIFRNVLP